MNKIISITPDRYYVIVDLVEFYLFSLNSDVSIDVKLFELQGPVNFNEIAKFKYYSVGTVIEPAGNNQNKIICLKISDEYYRVDYVVKTPKLLTVRRDAITEEIIIKYNKYGLPGSVLTESETNRLLHTGVIQLWGWCFTIHMDELIKFETYVDDFITPIIPSPVKFAVVEKQLNFEIEMLRTGLFDFKSIDKIAPVTFDSMLKQTPDYIMGLAYVPEVKKYCIVAHELQLNKYCLVKLDDPRAYIYSSHPPDDIYNVQNVPPDLLAKMESDGIISKYVYAYEIDFVRLNKLI